MKANKTLYGWFWRIICSHVFYCLLSWSATFTSYGERFQDPRQRWWEEQQTVKEMRTQTSNV